MSRPRQDLPPRGGFAPIKYIRHIPRKGFSGLAVLGGVTAISAAGLAAYIVKQTANNEISRARELERMEFLRKVDDYLHVKELEDVRRRATLDVEAMEQMYKTEQPARLQ